MSLTSYEEARPWAKSIKAQIASGKMPPWHATEPRGTFSNDRRLTDQEKETLVAWVDHGAPKGNPKNLPPVPTFAAGWEIGKPDVVLSMEKPYAVPASGTIHYQYVQIPTNFTEDKWIQAIEVRPGVRSVVHHILVFCREPEGTQAQPPFASVVPKLPAAGSSGDKRGPLIATTAPGTNGMTFPEGTALRIKAGSVLTFQIHYTANGKPSEDVSSVGLIFAKQPPQQEMRTSAFMNPMFTLPPAILTKKWTRPLSLLRTRMFTRSSRTLMCAGKIGRIRWFTRMDARGRCFLYRITISTGRPTTPSRSL
jgi:hypothetical protein